MENIKKKHIIEYYVTNVKLFCTSSLRYELINLLLKWQGSGKFWLLRPSSDVVLLLC